MASLCGLTALGILGSACAVDAESEELNQDSVAGVEAAIGEAGCATGAATASCVGSIHDVSPTTYNASSKSTATNDEPVHSASSWDVVGLRMQAT